MFGPLPHNRDHLGLIIKLDRFTRTYDGLEMRYQRCERAKKNGREFRNIVTLRTFFDVVEVIEPKTKNLARIGNGQTKFQFAQRINACSGL